MDLTGGVVTSINLHFPSDLVMLVKTAAKAGSLMTCATPAQVNRLHGVEPLLAWGCLAAGPYSQSGAWPRGRYGAQVLCLMSSSQQPSV